MNLTTEDLTLINSFIMQDIRAWEKIKAVSPLESVRNRIEDDFNLLGKIINELEERGQGHLVIPFGAVEVENCEPILSGSSNS